MSRADHATMSGASHFMIATHPKQFADMIIRHIERSSLTLAAAQ
jgi:hypothetical protein